MNKKKSFHSILRELENTEDSSFSSPSEQLYDPEALPLTDTMDIEILMHREAHFGGSFPIMLEYYKSDNKGVNEDISINRIEELQQIEQELNTNLAATLLTGPDAEKVAKAKKTYQQLKSLYEEKTSSYSTLIADIILSEDEYPEKEINALVAQGKLVTPALLALLKNLDFYDPLFPGYGTAPSLATIIIGLLKDPTAIPILFTTLSHTDFFAGQTTIQALKQIGDPAKDFLLKNFLSTPTTKENELALLVLIAFEDEEVAQHCLQILLKINTLQNSSFVTLLVLCCEHLQKEEDRALFIKLKNSQTINDSLLLDIQAIINNW